MTLQRVWSGERDEMPRCIELNQVLPVGIVAELASLWKVSKQRVRVLLASGRVAGVFRDQVTGVWQKMPGRVSVKIRSGRRGPRSKAFSTHLGHGTVQA